MARIPTSPPSPRHPRRAGKPRKDLRRIDLARRGLGVFVVMVLVLALVHARATGRLGGDPEVSAQVRNAGGSLRPGSDVKVAGVIVGKVTGIARGEEGNVRVAMDIPEDRMSQVPGNVVARILPATVFGTTYVDLVVYGAPDPEPLVPDAVIPADTEQGTLELQQALDDIDRLVTALGPAELQSAISSAAEALEGRGEKIGRIIDVADSYLAKLTPELPLVRSDLRQLADNLELIDSLAPDLLDATDDALVTLDTIVEQRAAITALITGGATLARSAGDFLDRNERQVVRLLDNGVLLLDVLYDNRQAGISDAIAANIYSGGRFPTGTHEGFLRSEAILQTDVPSYYTRADRPTYGPPASLRGATLRGMSSGRPEGAR